MSPRPGTQQTLRYGGAAVAERRLCAPASPELTQRGCVACLQGDDDLMTVCIGEIFLEFVNMLPAFQTYCLQQSSSVNMLNALEKEKELLR